MSKFLYPIYNLPNEYKQDLDVRELPLYMKWWLYKKSLVLPKEYKQVECITSTGTQYIDTGFIPTFNTKISVDFKSNKVYGETFTSLFGTQKSTDNGRLYCLFGATNNVQINIPSSRSNFVGLNDNGTYITNAGGNFFTNKRTNYIMDILNKTIQIENKTWDLSNYYSNFVSPDYNLFILTRNSFGIADGNCSKGVLYGTKIWNNNVLVRDFIPCYRKADNEVGLYDLVSKTFFTNSGTGNFIVGSNAPQNNLQSIQLNHNLAIENNEELFKVDELEESEEIENNETDY